MTVQLKKRDPDKLRPLRTVQPKPDPNKPRGHQDDTAQTTGLQRHGRLETAHRPIELSPLLIASLTGGSDFRRWQLSRTLFHLGELQRSNRQRHSFTPTTLPPRNGD